MTIKNAETALRTALALQQLTNANGDRSNVLRSVGTLLLTEGRYAEAAPFYEEILTSMHPAGTEKQDQFFASRIKSPS